MAAKRRRVFADTNVWASTLWKRGSATQAVALLAAGGAPPLVSDTVLEELARFVRRQAVKRPDIASQHHVWLQPGPGRRFSLIRPVKRSSGSRARSPKRTPPSWPPPWRVHRRIS